MPAQGSDLFLSPNEQDLLVAALNSNQGAKGAKNGKRGSPPTANDSSNPASGQLDYSDDSPYLDFDPDGEFDDYSYENSRMIGDLPPGLHEKRKSIDGEEDDDETVNGDRKRHEGDDKGPKKPGRKPLTSEPTTVRSTS
jgi:AP-1-like transcription factor